MADYLLTTLWDQRGSVNGTETEYNEFCPYDEEAERRCPTGCVNTAMSQIIYYFLESGRLDKSDFTLELTNDDIYSSSYNGFEITVSGDEDFAEKYKCLTFDEINVLLRSYSHNMSKEDNAHFIAALNFACGVEQEASYSGSVTVSSWSDNIYRYGLGSGSQSWISADCRYLNFTAQYFFDINGDTYSVSDAGFEVLIENLTEDNASPIAVSYPGHSLVMDGYDPETDMFHINFGWGDSSENRWYTRQEIRDRGYNDFFYDLSVETTETFIVNDTDIYGSGTFLRALERANGTKGSNSIIFEVEKVGNEHVLQRSLEITDDLRIVGFNYNIRNCEQHLFRVVNADFELNMKDGAAVSYGESAFGIFCDESSSCSVTLQNSGMFSVKDEYSVDNDLGDFFFANRDDLRNIFSSAASMSDSAIYLIYGQDGDDSLMLTDNSLVAGNLYLGGGDDTVTVKDSVLAGYVRNCENFLIDTDSYFYGYIYGDEDSLSLTVELKDDPHGEAVIDLNGYEQNLFNALNGRIVIDSSGAAAGRYKLIRSSNGLKYFRELSFDILSETGDIVSLSAGEKYFYEDSECEYSISLNENDNTVYLNVIYYGDDIAPSVPAELSAEIDDKAVLFDWADSTDDRQFAGYELKYVLDQQEYVCEVFDSSFSLADMPSGIYSWQVRAFDAAGNYSEWSSIASFAVMADRPAVYADIYEMTAHSVAVSAEFDRDCEIGWYSFDCIEWFEYYEPVIISENRTVYFRSSGKGGLFSDVTLYCVSNIDKSAPEIEVGSIVYDEKNTYADITINAHDDHEITAFKYRIGGGDWIDCGSGTVRMYTRGKISFCAEDKAGNVSEKEITVDRIISHQADDWHDMKKNGDLSEFTDRGYTVAPEEDFNIRGWVGREDKIDYQEIMLPYDSKLNFCVQSDAAVKVKVYQLIERTDKNGNIVSYKLKTLQNISVKKNKNKTGSWLYEVNSRDLLLEDGTYYVSVSGKKDTQYNIILHEDTKFFTLADNSDDWHDMNKNGANSEFIGRNDYEISSDTNGFCIEDWVGYGDAVDYNEFTVSGTAKINFSAEAGDKSKFVIYRLQENKNGMFKLKAVKSTKLKFSKESGKYTANTANLILDEGKYYIAMVSENASNGGDADYAIKADSCDFVVPSMADRSDDSWRKARDAENNIIHDWVGYGDAKDYFRFEYDGGKITFSAEEDTLEALKNKELKLSCLNSKGRKVTLVFDEENDCYVSRKELADGVYYLGVQTADHKKYWHEYEITIA